MADIGDMIKNSGFGAGLLAMPAVQAIKRAIDKKEDKINSLEDQNAELMRLQEQGSKPSGMKKGGKVSSASKRADGIAKRGKTRGKIV